MKVAHPVLTPLQLDGGVALAWTLSALGAGLLPPFAIEKSLVV